MTRAEIYAQLSTVIAGERVEDGLAAAIDLLGALVAFACDTPTAADRLLAVTLDDVKRDIRANWSETRLARAQRYLGARNQ